MGFHVIKARCLVAALCLFGSQYGLAAPGCPLPFFTPTEYFGRAFGSAEILTEYRYAHQDEDHVFTYIEYQTREKDYAPFYLVEILEGENGMYRIALGRLSKKAQAGETGAPEFAFRSTDNATSARLIKAVLPILLRTHYNPVPDAVRCLDGFVVQIALNAPGYGDLVADAYSPPRTSEAGAVVNLGRVLRKFVEGNADQQTIDAALIEVETHGKPQLN